MGWARVLIGGMCLGVLCSVSGRLAAQTGGQQGSEVAAKADTLPLPDAPLPAASTQQGGGPLSASSSLQASALNQPPSTGPSLGDLGRHQKHQRGAEQTGQDIRLIHQGRRWR